MPYEDHTKEAEDMQKRLKKMQKRLRKMQKRPNTVQERLKTTQERLETMQKSLKTMQKRLKNKQKRAHSGQQGSPWLPTAQDQSTAGPLPESLAAQSMHSIHAAPAVVHCWHPPAPIPSWFQWHVFSYKEPFALLKSGA